MDKEAELRILKNFILMMPKTYRMRMMNWCVVRDILMWGTSTSGSTSCAIKCGDLGIDPYEYKF